MNVDNGKTNQYANFLLNTSDLIFNLVTKSVLSVNVF